MSLRKKDVEFESLDSDFEEDDFIDDESLDEDYEYPQKKKKKS